MTVDAASSKGTVLITGASGFLGSAIAATMREAGYATRLLVRTSSPTVNLAADDVIVTGDLRDPASLRKAMRGAQYLVHAAADYRLWVPDPEEMNRINVDGTRALMAAALAEGVERIVYTSSVATLAPYDDGTPADESRRLDPDRAIGPYKRSKVLAERAVEAMIERDRLPAVIVSPSTPIGPRDVRPTPTGRVIVEAAAGRMPAFVDTGLNLAHVDDIAAGHLMALERGTVGERYILGGENVLLSTMLTEIAGIVGRRPPRIELPRAAIYPLALGAELYARLTGREPFVTRDGLRMSRYRMFFDDAKARRELGYTSRPYREGLVDAIAWFRQSGVLK